LRASEDAQLSDGRLNGAGRRLSEAADRGVLHGPRHLVEQGELLRHRAQRPSRGDARHELLLPLRPDAAGNALAAGLVAEEGGDAADGVRDVRALVEDHDDSRAEGSADRARALEGEWRIQGVGPDEESGRAAEENAPDRPAFRNSAGLLEELAEGRAELDLVDAGPGDVAREAEELGSRRLAAADSRKRGAAAEDDVRHADQRLDVVDDGGLPEEALLHGER